MSRVFGGAAALVVAIGMVLVINTTGALAYQTGTIGYDISYPQCGSSFLTTTGPSRMAQPYGSLDIGRAASTRAGGSDEAAPPGRELALFADVRNYRRRSRPTVRLQPGKSVPGPRVLAHAKPGAVREHRV